MSTIRIKDLGAISPPVDTDSVATDGASGTRRVTVADMVKGTKLQARPVDAAAPSSGQVLRWDGSKWAPATVSAGRVLDRWNETDVSQISANLSDRAPSLPLPATYVGTVAYSKVDTPAGPAIRVVPGNTFTGRDIRPIFTGLTGKRWILRAGIAKMANWTTSSPRFGFSFCNGQSAGAFRGLTLALQQASASMYVARDLGNIIAFGEGDAKRFDFNGPNIPADKQAPTWLEFELALQANPIVGANDWAARVQGIDRDNSPSGKTLAGEDATTGSTYPGGGYPTWEPCTVNTLAISVMCSSAQTGATLDLVGLELLKHPMDE